ncbi:MAG TPA: hypothetical protein VG847_02665 [Chitinophagaceae bacterium]|nr:hypothetical protein [Chitinophagaceae bacterium]
MNKIDVATLLAAILLLITIFVTVIFSIKKRKLLSAKKSIFPPKVVTYRWEKIPQSEQRQNKKHNTETEHYKISKKLVLENHEQYCFENTF